MTYRREEQVSVELLNQGSRGPGTHDHHASWIEMKVGSARTSVVLACAVAAGWAILTVELGLWSARACTDVDVLAATAAVRIGADLGNTG